MQTNSKGQDEKAEQHNKKWKGTGWTTHMKEAGTLNKNREGKAGENLKGAIMQNSLYQWSIFL